MRKIYKRSFCLLFAAMVFVLFQSVSCPAWIPPKTEDEEKFLEWYQNHKNDENAVYTLNGDLTLTKGTEENPVRFDGRGKVRINCGAHGIIANSKVIIDNPNLTLSGESMFVLMENSADSHLILKQGTILDNSDYACAVQVIRGTLQTSPDPSDRFRIRIKGQDISGIYNGADEPLALGQLDITAEGTDRVDGIKNNINQRVSLTDCNIKVSGDQEAWGISNQGKTEVNRCRISAFVSDPLGTAVSASGTEVFSRDSKLIPEITGTEYTIYSIYDIDSFFPAVGRTGADFKKLLPENASVYMENVQTKEQSIISVPVTWDLSKLEPSKEGITILYGRLLTNDLFGVYINSSGVRPKTAVITLPPEGMFLNSYKILDKTKERIKGMLELPFPDGADSMILQYSEDRKNWKTYSEKNGNTNIIKGESFPKPYGVLSFVFEIPVSAKTFYMRTKTAGSSIFSGTSAVWEINTDRESSGSSVSGESGGDRGGQNVDQEDASAGEEQKREDKTGHFKQSFQNKNKQAVLDKDPEKRREIKKREGTQNKQRGKEGNAHHKKISRKVQEEEERIRNMDAKVKEKEVNKNERNIVFPVISILLVFGSAALLGKKFFSRNDLS